MSDSRADCGRIDLRQLPTPRRSVLLSVPASLWAIKKAAAPEGTAAVETFDGPRQRLARRPAAIGAALQYSRFESLNHLLSQKKSQPSQPLRGRRRAVFSPTVAGERIGIIEGKG